MSSKVVLTLELVDREKPGQGMDQFWQEHEYGVINRRKKRDMRGLSMVAC
jgi:hypothetical protein